jgi:hypothetical protein
MNNFRNVAIRKKAMKKLKFSNISEKNRKKKALLIRGALDDTRSRLTIWKELTQTDRHWHTHQQKRYGQLQEQQLHLSAGEQPPTGGGQALKILFEGTVWCQHRGSRRQRLFGRFRPFSLSAFPPAVGHLRSSHPPVRPMWLWNLIN